MRCDCCPLGSDEDVCPEAENEYGIEHKDGVLGCKRLETGWKSGIMNTPNISAKWVLIWELK